MAAGDANRNAWGSLLSAEEFAAVVGVGFDPVGYVFGTAVVHQGYVSRAGRCSSSGSYTPRTDLAASTGGPFGTLLRKQYAARRLALSRAVERCAALGGDGIVAVTLDIKPFDAGGTEFTVRGTAVRARGAIRPPAPFTSHLSAQSFALLLNSGWVPLALVFGISLASRHDDTAARAQTRRSAASREVHSYTELVKDARRDARAQLRQAVEATGAQGVVVDAMTLSIGERECPSLEGQHDHLAEATILGTAIVSFDRTRTAARRPLTIMRLNPAAAGVEREPLAPPAAPSSFTDEIPEGSVLDRYTAKRSAARASRSIISTSDTTSVSRRAAREHNEE